MTDAPYRCHCCKTDFAEPARDVRHEWVVASARSFRFRLAAVTTSTCPRCGSRNYEPFRPAQVAA